MISVNEMIEHFFGFSKIGYLQELANTYGDFKVARGWKDTTEEIKWTKHRSVLECWQSVEGLTFLKESNNRQGLPNEIRIDIDAGERTPEEVRKQFDDACDALDTIHLHYLGFSSGSRGYHIHLFLFDPGKDKNIMRTAKENLIRLLGGELLKVNESPMLTLEWSPNNKTGKPKIPIRGDAIWLDVNK
jgi:hypothetical protein